MEKTSCVLCWLKIGVLAAHHPGVAICVVLGLLAAITLVVSKRIRTWVFSKVDRAIDRIGRLIYLLVRAAIVAVAIIIVGGLIYATIQVIDMITPAAKPEGIKVCVQGCNDSSTSTVNSFMPMSK